MTPERFIELKHLTVPIQIEIDGGRLKECIEEIERLKAENARILDELKSWEERFPTRRCPTSPTTAD
jgi:hypothetical protein